MSETTTTDAQEAAQPDAEQQTFTADYVAKLRAENANYRTKAKENAKAADELPRSATPTSLKRRSWPNRSRRPSRRHRTGSSATRRRPSVTM